MTWIGDHTQQPIPLRTMVFLGKAKHLFVILKKKKVWILLQYLIFCLFSVVHMIQKPNWLEAMKHCMVEFQVFIYKNYEAVVL
jgi:hypothetical protein